MFINTYLCFEMRRFFWWIQQNRLRPRWTVIILGILLLVNQRLIELIEIIIRMALGPKPLAKTTCELNAGCSYRSENFKYSNSTNLSDAYFVSWTTQSAILSIPWQFFSKGSTPYKYCVQKEVSHGPYLFFQVFFHFCFVEMRCCGS